MIDEATEAKADVVPQEGATTEVKADETPTIDELLQSYDDEVTAKPVGQGNTQQGNQQEPYNADISQTEIAEMREYYRQQNAQNQDKDLTEAAERFQSFDNSLADLPVTVFKGHLQSMTKDRRFVEAWLNRHQSPGKWNKVVDAVARDFAKDWGEKPDKRITDNMAALNASINTSDSKSTDGPSDAQVGAMTPNEFAEHKRSLGLDISEY